MFSLFDFIDNKICEYHHRKLRALGGSGLYRAEGGHWLLLTFDSRRSDQVGATEDSPSAEDLVALIENTEATRHAQEYEDAWRRRSYRISRRREFIRRWIWRLFHMEVR